MAPARTATNGPGPTAPAEHPTGPRRILLLHDGGEAAERVIEALADVEPDARVVRIDGAPALEAALRARDWDAALVAGSLEQIGLEAAVSRLSRHDHDLPLIVVGDGDREFARRATGAGAHDVVDAHAPEALRDALAAALLRPRRDDAQADERVEGSTPPLRALALLAAGLERADTPGDALAATVDALARGLGLPYVETWLLHDDGVRLVPGPAYEADPAYASLRDGPAGRPPPGRSGLVREVARTRQPRAIRDLRGDDARLFRRTTAALELGLVAAHAAPAVVAGRAAAVVLTLGDEARLLEDDDLVALDLAAALLGAALGRLADAAALRAEREHAAALLDHVADAIVACDAEGRLTFVNPAMEVLHGAPMRVGAERAEWSRGVRLLLADGLTPMPEELTPLLRALGGESFDDVEYAVDDASGRRRVLRASGQPIAGDAGETRGAVIAVRDVTDRVAAEQAAAAATEQALTTYSLLLDDLAELAGYVGEAEDLSEVWAGVLEFAHHTLGADELVVVRSDHDAPLYAARYLPRGGVEAVPDPALVHVGEALARAMRERTVAIEHGALVGDLLSEGSPDRTRSVAAVPMMLEGEVLGGFEVRADALAAFGDSAAVALSMAANLAAIALDHHDLVVGERRARAEAETAARHFQQVFEANPAAVAISSLRDDRIIDVNPAMEALLGFGRDELFGQRAVDLGIWPDPADRAAIAEAARRQEPVRGREVRMRRKDGVVRDCLLSADATELHGESAMLLLVVDVSERIEQQQRLRNLARFRESLMAFIGETLDVGFDGPFYQRLLQSAVEATPGAQAGSLLVRDVGADTYRFVASVGYDLDGLQALTFFDHEIAAAQVEGRAVVTKRLPTAEERSDRGDALRRYGRLDEIASALTVPIHLEGQRVAVLTLDNFDEEGAFDEEALQLAEAFATQVATLIKRRALEHELEHMAYHDHLTGLPNRVLFRDRLQQAISRAVRTNRRGAAIFIDLDNLKVTNDALGHGVGDELLKAVAGRLKASIRADDTVARIGGDEFTMVLPDVGDAAAAAGVAEKILTALREPFRLGGHEVHASASVGITLFPDDATDADSLIQHGDTAMYQAKSHGKDRYRFFTREMNLQLLERAALETQLRKALERDEFTLHFQPRVALDDGRITSVEALARWHHPERGWISPATFIPVAEEAGLVTAVGAHLLDLACRQAKAWERSGTPAVVAVNLSARQLQERDLVRGVREALERSGLDPASLELELTESAIMRNVGENVVKLTELRSLGVSISIDDFGTAYSSLNYLKRLPATALKIDQSFLRDIGDDPGAAPHDAAIIRAVVALASALEMTAIAEGVETLAQLRFLRAVGCEQGQGYLFARPAPAEELEATLRLGRVEIPAA